RCQNSGGRSGIVVYVPVWTVGTGPRSFHSWQAASHALQPMQVVVSMYFATTGSRRIPVFSPQSEAEERRISRVWVGIAASLHFLELHQEGLVLGRPGVRVHGRGRQHVGEGSRVAGVAGEAPMDRETDLPEVLAVDLQRAK